MSPAKEPAVEVLLIEQRVSALEAIATKTEPLLNQILTAVQGLEITLRHAAENHRGLSERVEDHEARLRITESKHNASDDHETRLRKLETEAAQTWYLKPLSYSAFLAAMGAFAAAVWKLVAY